MMWEDDYRQVQDKLDAPEDWQIKTLQRMKEVRQAKKRPSFKQRSMFGVLVAGCTIIFFFVLTNGFLDETTDLNFQRLDTGSRVFATGDHGRRGSLVGMERALEVWLSEWELEAFILVDATWQEEGPLSIQYFFESSEASILIRVNRNTYHVETNSILGGVALGLYYRLELMETIFIAEFIYDGLYVQVEGGGIEEAQFVEQIQHLLNFLNYYQSR